MTIVLQSSTVLLLGVVALAGCADRPTGPIPATGLAGDLAIDVGSRPVCDVDGADWEGDRDAAVLNDLAPGGPLRVAINFGNPNNASRNPGTGQLSGVAVDMACKLAHGTDAQLVALPYAGIPQMLTGLARGEWDVAFTLDPSTAPGSAAGAIPHIGVANTYLVPGNAPFQSVADVDAPGVLISVGQSNAPDLYLTRTLKNATLVRTPTVPQALALLRTGQVTAFAGSRSVEAAFIASSFPNGRMLPDNFLIANIGMVLALGHGEGLGYVNEFVDWSKTSGLVGLAIQRAALIGDVIPPPPPVEQRIAFLRNHVARLVTNGVLSKGRGHALAVKLGAALKKLADGETEPAMQKVNAFIHQVEAFRNAGILSEAQSASLLEIARDVVTGAGQDVADDAGGEKHEGRERKDDGLEERE
jgi:polar amino acid transport system substrate-binding protein